MGRDMDEEAQVRTKVTTRLVRGGDLVADVSVELIEDDRGWAPHLSLNDAYRLDDVRDALRSGELATLLLLLIVSIGSRRSPRSRCEDRVAYRGLPHVRTRLG